MRACVRARACLIRIRNRVLVNKITRARHSGRGSVHVRRPELTWKMHVPTVTMVVVSNGSSRPHVLPPLGRPAVITTRCALRL